MHEKQIQYNYPNLSNKQVVIAGGTGAVGEGIVRTYLRSKAKVIVLTRSDYSRESLKELLSDEKNFSSLSFVVGDYNSFSGAETLANKIVSEHGEVTDVVTSIGGWWQGKTLWKVTQEEWDEYFVSYSTTQLAMVRAWIPSLPKTGTFQIVTGGSGVTPIPHSGLISMEQASLLMMANVLEKETQGNRRIFSYIFGYINTRDRAVKKPEWISSEDVGYIAALASANDSLESGQHKVLNQDYFKEKVSEFTNF